MKCMIISDIHGDIYNLNKVLDIYSKEKCNKLFILGDLFNYGISLNNDDIINRLNVMKDSIIGVCGNCDNNIKNNLFSMPYINRTNINNIILIGHSHIADIERVGDKLLINPGSISKSRYGENSFAIIDNNIVTIRNLDNQILIEEKI